MTDRNIDTNSGQFSVEGTFECYWENPKLWEWVAEMHKNLRTEMVAKLIETALTVYAGMANESDGGTVTVSNEGNGEVWINFGTAYRYRIEVREYAS